MHTLAGVLARYLQGCPQFPGIDLGCRLQQSHYKSLQVSGECCLQGLQQILQNKGPRGTGLAVCRGGRLVVYTPGQN